ncbi:MAG: hypothetical protein GDA49_04480 [Rhodospirillales bacterium]|nr:hypothetical protein [Rhodospirillales bacterium]
MTLTIGDIRIEESCDVVGAPHEDFPDAAPEAIEPYLVMADAGSDRPPATGGCIMPVRSSLVNRCYHTLLLNIWVGNHKNHPGMPIWGQRTDYRQLDDMAAVGVGPEDVDFVLCSHLYLDHAGWNTRQEDGRWVLTFPNACYLFNKDDLGFRRFLESVADTDILMMMMHFPAPSVEHVFSRGNGFGFRYDGCDMVHG